MFGMRESVLSKEIWTCFYREKKKINWVITKWCITPSAMYYNGKNSVLWDYWLKLEVMERQLCMIKTCWVQRMLEKEGKRLEVVQEFFKCSTTWAAIIWKRVHHPIGLKKQAHVAGACGAKREMLWDESEEVNKGYVKL